MQTIFYHTVNEGLYMQNQNVSLLIDGIHDGISVGYSNMPPGLIYCMDNHLGIFSGLNGLLFTHLHPDHFSNMKVMNYLIQNPLTFVYGPDLIYNTKTPSAVTPEVEKLTFRHFQIYSIHTIHEGEQFKNVTHRIFLIKAGNESFVIGGDAVLSPREAGILSKLTNFPVTALFVNAYQLVSPDTHAFIRRLRPSRVFLYHRPFPKDDVNNMKGIVKNVLRYYPKDLPQPEVLALMDWIDDKSTEEYIPETAGWIDHKPAEEHAPELAGWIDNRAAGERSLELTDPYASVHH